MFHFRRPRNALSSQTVRATVQLAHPASGPETDAALCTAHTWHTEHQNQQGISWELAELLYVFPVD